MANPPSVVKITRDGVTFTDRSKLVGWTMEQLQRRALIDVGRFLTYEMRRKVRARNKWLQKSKYAPQRYQYWVRRKENDMLIGVENTTKGAVTAWWADQSELGTNRQPRRPILQETVYANLKTIQEIEAQYLSLLNDDDSALAAASEAPEKDVNE